MPIGAGQILSTVARELSNSEDDLLKQGLRSFLERQLCEVKAQIFQISGRYGASSVIEWKCAIGRELWKRLIHGEICSAWTIWSISEIVCYSFLRLWCEADRCRATA